MKVTFPHMGNMYISIKVLLETIGIKYVMPPFCNKKTLEVGSAYSPEFVCLPFKILLGNFIRAIENGANVILMGGGCGQCRLGYYGDLQAEILKSLGYKAELICLDVGNMTFKDVLDKLRPLTEGRSVIDILKGIVYAVRTVLLVDRLNKLANHIRCREINKGEADSVMRQFHSSIEKAVGFKGVKDILTSTRNQLKKIGIDKKVQPLKVAIVGEIYVSLEPFTNLNIEKFLGNMGVEVHNTLSISHWITSHFIKNILPVKLKDKPREAGKEFMRTDDIGGHGLETIGNSVLSAKCKYDGVIHIFPFTCMPEIIAQSTFGELQDKYNIPIMTLIIDEMTGEAGYMTRVEAFIDMLERKRGYGKKDIEAC